MAERDIHTRVDIHGNEVNPGDPGYDNIPPTPEQEEHYAEQREAKPTRRAAAKKDDEK